MVIAYGQHRWKNCAAATAGNADYRLLIQQDTRSMIGLGSGSWKKTKIAMDNERKTLIADERDHGCVLEADSMSG